MSVYIQIKNASLAQRPASPPYLLIESSSAILKTIESPSSKTPFWQSSFICSIRQRYLHFRLCLNPYSHSSTHIPSGTSLEEMRANKTIALGELPFQYFQHMPGKEAIMRLELVSQNQRGQRKKEGYLDLLVLYEPNKNYVGQMQFYEFSQILTQHNLQPPQIVTQPQQYPHNYEKASRMVAANYSSKLSSKMGTSGAKNLFNCCDRPVHDQENQIFEPHYYHQHRNGHNQRNY